MKKLNILCILLLIVFCVSLIQNIIFPFFEGVEYGKMIKTFEKNTQQQLTSFLQVDISPRHPDYLQSNEKNEKTGEQVLISPTNVSLFINTVPEKPSWWIFVQIVNTAFFILIIVAGIWIPFLVIRVLLFLNRSEFFDRKILKRIYKIGILLLIIGISNSIFQYLSIFSASTFIDLSHYSFSYSKAIDFNTIVLGIVVLIMHQNKINNHTTSQIFLI